MNSPGYTQKFLRKRKMLLVMPILIVPFVTMAFWALGGGNAALSISTNQQGFNFNLPTANAKDDSKADKLSFYDQAERDSLKLEELMRKDPYYKQLRESSKSSTSEIEGIASGTAAKYATQLIASPNIHTGENAEDKLLKKLKDLETQMNSPEQISESAVGPKNAKAESQDIQMLNKLRALSTTQDQSANLDPQLKEIDKTLDKILDIQHPDRIKKQEKESEEKKNNEVMHVKERHAAGSISLLGEAPDDSHISKFFSDTDEVVASERGNFIEAVVQQDQTLIQGSIVKFRLQSDIEVDRLQLPAGTFLHGIVQITDERIAIQISTIKFNRYLLPVKLLVYDLDGLPGISVPGAIVSETGKQATDNSLPLLEIGSLDPSLKARAATAGISTLKTLIGKRTKHTKVRIKAGYKVLLVEAKTIN